MLFRRLGVRVRAHAWPSVRALAGQPLTTSTTADTDVHAPIRRDVKFLGWALGEAIRNSPDGGEQTYQTVETLRSLAKEWRSDGREDAAKFTQIVELCKGMPAERIREVARAFTHFLALANAAEANHRVRRGRQREVHAGSPQESFAAYEKQPLNTTMGVLQQLLGHGGGGGDVPAAARASGDEIYDALSSQCVEIILTAHPTEVNRRTVVQRHRAIDALLAQLDVLSTSGTWQEIEDCRQALIREVQTLWWTDEIRREKPTPLKEARHGLQIAATSMWRAVPDVLRRLDAELVAAPEIGRPLPPDVAPLRFGSWMGGDRDGNPNVTPAITREVILESRLRAAELIEESLVELRDAISVSVAKATPEMLGLLEAWAPEPESDPLHVVLNHQPYARFFDILARRASATQRMAAQGELSAAGSGESMAVADTPLATGAELLDALLVAHRSLCEAGLEHVASGRLLDLIRQVKCFGLTLLPLDVRNESVRHAEALDAVTRYLGQGSYLNWDEETRVSWLLKELNEKRPLLPSVHGAHGGGGSYSALGSMFDETVCDTLGTFDMIAQMPPESLGAYVISMAQQASDVLAVRLLQAEAGVVSPMRVVPLFETLDDLENAPKVMVSLWSMAWYRGDSNAKQEVMLGYSDSAKDAGRLAAAWAQYTAQEQLVVAAADAGVELSLFHGKGGTVSRGGDPQIFRALCAQPPGTVSGKFRITEQGEIITQNYADRLVAQRHLETWCAALLYERFLPHGPREPTPEYRALLDRMSETSCAAYRNTVRHEPAFIPYFRSATPELEIASLNVGSRPAKRRPGGGVETLRAIPWVFAWTQTRLNLTAWLGMGPAFEELGTEERGTLRKMYEEWPWFTALIDVVDMTLAKTETEIAANYDSQLVAPLKLESTDGEETPVDAATLVALGERLRGELDTTCGSILALRGYEVPQQENLLLQRSLRVRNPYVDPLNVLQAEVLRRLREESYDSSSEQQLLQDALTITINGIANGQKNTG